MANFTQSISESLRVFGCKTDYWGSFNWGAYKWGEGTADFPVSVANVVSESFAPTDTISKLDPISVIGDSISPTNNNTSETLTDGSGWYYVYPSDVTNHENQSLVSYTSGSNIGSNWSLASASATTWS